MELIRAAARKIDAGIVVTDHVVSILADPLGHESKEGCHEAETEVDGVEDGETLDPHRQANDPG